MSTSQVLKQSLSICRNDNRKQNIGLLAASTGERTMDTIDAVSVDAERNDNLKKAKLENGFYNIIDGEKVSPSKRLTLVDPATGKRLVP